MASQTGYFNVQELTDAGAPLVGGMLYTYAYGTTTQKVAYTDAAGLVPHTYTLDANLVPYIALNARGELPAPLYLLSGSYDLALKRADGSSVWTRRADGQSDAANTLRSDLVASSGSSLSGFIQSGSGSVARTAQDKMRDRASLKDFGAIGDGTTDDATDVQNAASSSLSIDATDGIYKLGSKVTMAVAKSFIGRGLQTSFTTSATFNDDIFKISPTASTDSKNFTVANFQVTNAGSANSVFALDLGAVGKYLSKFELSKIISTAAVDEYFVKLINVNTDGLFTSLFCDNWSYGGYYLDNVGDSVILERNTTTGAGVGYYINQISTAANIAIRDGNCTCNGGALYVVKGANITFENMQVECPNAFTGADNAVVSVHHDNTGLVFNTKIINCNINTQGNPLYCVYLQYTDLTFLDGLQLYCDPAVGAHIYIDTGARNTIIGNNKYFSSVDGTEIDPIIVDNGVGTVGAWTNASISLSGWTSQNTANEHQLGFFKDRDGNVLMRGRVAGAAIAGGETLFTLPTGFRPKTKAYIFGTYGSGGTTSCQIQVEAIGLVKLLTAGTTGAYFAGIVFSTK